MAEGCDALRFGGGTSGFEVPVLASFMVSGAESGFGDWAALEEDGGNICGKL